MFTKQSQNRLFPLALLSALSLSGLQACAQHAKTDGTVAENQTTDRAPASVLNNFPILEAIEANGGKLAAQTTDWMKKWKGMDLEDDTKYQFKELSGSTSINLKIQKIDTTDPKGYKSRGSFVPRNGAANFDLEIAYFNLSAILGWDQIFRPTARYELGARASSAFRSLIANTAIKGSNRLENKTRILNAIATGNPLKGCVKAKKPDTEIALEEISASNIGPTGGPKPSHPVVASLQASNPMPKAGQTVTLKKGYDGDALELAHEFSILMTLDSIFQQWDRYSGGNVVIFKDEAGKAHFIGTDNGGGDVTKTTGWVERNLGWFSRYDRNAIAKLKELSAFFDNPSKGFLGYTNAETFVVDLGLYAELSPGAYVERLNRNLKMLIERVRTVEAKYGSKAYLD